MLWHKYITNTLQSSNVVSFWRGPDIVPARNPCSAARYMSGKAVGMEESC